MAEQFMRRYQGLSDTDYDTSYADRPPPTPSPTSTDFHSYNEQQLHQRHHSIQEPITETISSPASSVNLHHLNHVQQSHLLNRRHTSHHSISVPSMPVLNRELLGIEQDFSIPSYDETIIRDQELVNAAARMSVSSSVQSNTNNTASQDSHVLNDPSGNSSTQEAANNSNERRQHKNLLKVLGLNFLNARQHLALAICRDCVLILPLYHAFCCFKLAYYMDHSRSIPAATEMSAKVVEQLISPGSSEHFIAGIWCLVAAYLSFAVLDGLVVRWIVTYQTSAAILRVLSMSLLLITIEQATLAIFSPGGTYSLHTWILISCILTGAYIIQNFVTSNLDLKNENKARSVDYYNITVYAVVPVGLASFVSMIGLLRALLILRLDLENRELGTDRWVF